MTELLAHNMIGKVLKILLFFSENAIISGPLHFFSQNLYLY